MPIILKNNVDSTLAQAINASETAVIVTAGDGAKFPALGAGDYFYATLVSAQNTREIVKVTGKSIDTLAITRAQEGTTANGFAVGSRVEMRVTAASITDLVDSVNVLTQIETNYNWMGFFGTWQNGYAFKVRTAAREFGGSGATFARIGLVDDGVTMYAAKGVHQPSAIRIQRNATNAQAASATMVMNLTQTETKPLLGKNICVQLHALKSAGFTGNTIDVRVQYSKEPQQPIVASDGNYTSGNTVLTQESFTLTETMPEESDPYYATGQLPQDAVQVAIVVTVPWIGTAPADDYVEIEGCFLTIGSTPATIQRESFESLLLKAKTRYQTTYPYSAPRGSATKAGSLRATATSTSTTSGVVVSARFDPPMAGVPQVLMQSPLSGTENRWENETTGVFTSGLVYNVSDQGATFQNNGAVAVGNVLLSHWTARCVF